MWEFNEEVKIHTGNAVFLFVCFFFGGGVGGWKGSYQV